MPCLFRIGPMPGRVSAAWWVMPMPHLLNVSNLAIGRLLSGYVANDAVRSEINRWIGSGSAEG